jgi:hypothetical protein
LAGILLDLVAAPEGKLPNIKVHGT